MRAVTELFTINGRPMLVPDMQVQVSYEDLDSSESGRDEQGFMHRSVLRNKVPSWKFTYQHLTEEEKQYMEGLFGQTATFLFGHPDRLDATQQQISTCYRSKYTISWQNARTGLWNGYGFSIIAC